MKTDYDVLIIGGGINGCGIAADAAMRGLSVCLVEAGDLASQTSSNSSKLIHGGLRYLEQFDFTMVKKALDERSVLMKVAPHLVKPLPFFIPYHQQMRPKWLIRLGLFLYDHLSRKNTLPNSQIHHRNNPLSINYFSPLADSYRSGFTYYDAQTNDARLTIANAQQAKNYGAHILPYHRFVSASPIKQSQWQASISHQNTLIQTCAKVIINATGPWVNLVNKQLGITDPLPINWIKGSHLVVKQLYEGNHAYLLQGTDKRIIFITPYFQYSMIGTTDVPVDDITKPPHIEPEEIHYLLDLAQQYFKRPIHESDVICTWSGIRPLIGDQHEQAQKMSRDYQLHLTKSPATVLSIYGGKITTYRQLSNQALEKIREYFPHMGSCITDEVSLPGGNIPSHQWQSFYQTKQRQYHWISATLFNRYITTYGNLIDRLLSNCEQIGDLGQHFGDDLYEREIAYLIEHEWATKTEDVLRRLTDIGLTAQTDTIMHLNDYFKGRGTGRDPDSL
ncbi:glycerol-3-phosphate dehydrogenase [Legionella sp. W05-934-2]|jgi:glycerol-3-phosphate dehydrogenase|uniref:glycerol-3-phosphate dehydrogenase n=1 Tax=Legionella sp. W05-934-2 TaxID=1198649 RepID=UPI003462722F